MVHSQYTNHQIEIRSISDLRPFGCNARTHEARQIRLIADSIRAFGFTNPVLVDQNDQIVAGHGRVLAAELLGMNEVPTLRISHLSDDEIRAYVIADNRIAELAEWDHETLAIELQHLTEIDIDLDIEVTGFAAAEIDLLIGATAEAGDCDAADEFEAPSGTETPVTVRGDVWLLGRHRLGCGNALELGDLETLLERRQVRMVFTDPPYNVPIHGNVCGSGRIEHREFAMASGEMSSDEFTAFLTETLDHMAEWCLPGALIFVCMDWRHQMELLEATNSTGLRQINLCVWVKDNGGMGPLYRSQHELVGVFKLGDGPHTNNVQLGRFGRNRTNVWQYPGINSLRAGRLDELAMHPTVKPVAMVSDAILDCTNRGDIVLDGFAGSGTTIIAAERAGRVCCGLEIDPIYVDTAIGRWQTMTGEPVVHAVTGKTFEEVRRVREEEGHPLPPYRVRRRLDI